MTLFYHVAASGLRAKLLQCRVAALYLLLFIVIAWSGPKRFRPSANVKDHPENERESKRGRWEPGQRV